MYKTQEKIEIVQLTASHWLLMLMVAAAEKKLTVSSAAGNFNFPSVPHCAELEASAIL